MAACARATSRIACDIIACWSRDGQLLDARWSRDCGTLAGRWGSVERCCAAGRAGDARWSRITAALVAHHGQSLAAVQPTVVRCLRKACARRLLDAMCIALGATARGLASRATWWRRPPPRGRRPASLRRCRDG
ncbi:hypothetical protein F511_34569 [Dorcoceras hygrometricum]|uniref:Uncharacterized protein n=1 Tax=Dorcoceras hygrometricum TaxID=472368 RepID=A0A2Z7BFN5_9LAMI|nr:hypothetical protein F511_34569 [Dorcoceras hygrometricum]